MITDYQNNNLSIQPPEWASRYNLPPVAAYWLDQFAIRGFGSIKIPAIDDIVRLRNFRDAMNEAGKPIFASTIKAVLCNEYHFTDENAQYYADEIVSENLFKELEGSDEGN